MRDDVRVRAASDSDAATIGAFINICTQTYQGVSRSSTEEALMRLHIAESDPATDAFVALRREQCIGFAHLWRFTATEVRCFARVHPDAQGEGIGSELLARGQARAAEILDGTGSSRMPPTITATAWERDRGAAELLRGRGFATIRHFVTMAIAADRVNSVAELPGGIAVRSLQPTDEQELFAAFQDAFAEHWGMTDDDPAVWWAERRDSVPPGQFDASLWLLAVDEGQIVGFALCELRKDGERSRGRVAEIGVRKLRRGEGIGFALLSSALARLGERGASEITLDVDSANVTSAVRLYLKAGMVARPAFTVWERELIRVG